MLSKRCSRDLLMWCPNPPLDVFFVLFSCSPFLNGPNPFRCLTLLVVSRSLRCVVVCSVHTAWSSPLTVVRLMCTCVVLRRGYVLVYSLGVFYCLLLSRFFVFVLFGFFSVPSCKSYCLFLSFVVRSVLPFLVD